MSETLALNRLPAPLNTVVIENKRGEYRDFNLSPDDPYPLKGVTYPVDYGFLPGYIGEDHAELDFFIGSDIEGKCGSITVARGDTPAGEHKFYVGLTAAEVQSVIAEFQPVLIGREDFAGLSTLLIATQAYKER